MHCDEFPDGKRRRMIGAELANHDLFMEGCSVHNEGAMRGQVVDAVFSLGGDPGNVRVTFKDNVLQLRFSGAVEIWGA